MVRDVAFGQYFPGKSLMHRLDPRAKLVCFIAFVVLIFFTFNYASLGLIAAFMIFMIAASGVSPKFYFKSLKVILFVVLITSVLNLFYGSGEPIWQWWILRVTWNGIHRAAFVTVRIICLILASSCLTFTTSPTELTDAMERLMKPLAAIHFPVSARRNRQNYAGSEGERRRSGVGRILQARKGADSDSDTAFCFGVQTRV